VGQSSVTSHYSGLLEIMVSNMGCNGNPLNLTTERLLFFLASRIPINTRNTLSELLHVKERYLAMSETNAWNGVTGNV
jgi:hypothetical protein